jgi:hypothetical protein
MSEGNQSRPPKRDRPQPSQGQPARKSSKPKRGGIWLQQLGGNDYALSHPKCVAEMEPDYAEGLELWREGDVEAARDALRYALQGCGDNLWVHVALGRIALQEDSDPKLARGHFGYAFELAQRAIPPHFEGRLPIEHPSNAPLYDAIDGLIACHEALKSPELAEEIRSLARRWSTGGRGRGPRG